MRYRIDTAMERSVQWQLRDGRACEVRMSVEREVRLDERAGSEYPQDWTLRMSAHVNGQRIDVGCAYVERGVPAGAPAGYVGHIGRLLLGASEMSRIESAVAECEACPEMAEQAAREARGREAEDRVNDGRARIERAL